MPTLHFFVDEETDARIEVIRAYLADSTRLDAREISTAEVVKEAIAHTERCVTETERVVADLKKEGGR